MKKLIIFFAAIMALLLSSCNQPASMQSMLEDPETRNEVFSAIIDDDQMMSDFMNHMVESEHGMEMVRGHKGMMNHMMHDGYLRNWMKEDAEARGQMAKDGQMMGMMMQMIHENGMMSEECLQSTMQMMKDNGMDVEDMPMQGQ